MRFTRLMHLVLPALAAGLLSACGYTSLSITSGIVGSGNVVAEIREIGSIQAVVLNSGGELTITQGETNSLVIRADDNILPLLTSDVSDGALVLELKRGASGYTTNTGVSYQLTVSDLDTITANSAGNVKVEALLADHVALILNGSGDINVERIEAETADFELASAGSLVVTTVDARTVALLIGGSGDASIAHLNATTLDTRLVSAGDATISGSAEHQQVRLQGSGSFHGETLAGADATLDLSSSGNASVNVAETLDVTISGSGSVTYHGDPAISQQLSSAGQLIHAAR